MGKGWSVNYRLFEDDPGSIGEDPTGEDPTFIDDFLAYINSPRGELSAAVSETVSVVLERADVDARNRQIIWEDGKRLSISGSAQRISSEHPDFPMDLIEAHVIAGRTGSSPRQSIRRNSYTNSMSSPKRGLRTMNARPRRAKSVRELPALE